MLSAEMRKDKFYVATKKAIAAKAKKLITVRLKYMLGLFI
jgi:hypothetical protein